MAFVGAHHDEYLQVIPPLSAISLRFHENISYEMPNDFPEWDVILTRMVFTGAGKTFLATTSP